MLSSHCRTLQIAWDDYSVSRLNNNYGNADTKAVAVFYSSCRSRHHILMYYCRTALERFFQTRGDQNCHYSPGKTERQNLLCYPSVYKVGNTTDFLPRATKTSSFCLIFINCSEHYKDLCKGKPGGWLYTVNFHLQAHIPPTRFLNRHVEDAAKLKILLQRVIIFSSLFLSSLFRNACPCTLWFQGILRPQQVH